MGFFYFVGWMLKILGYHDAYASGVIHAIAGGFALGVLVVLGGSIGPVTFGYMLDIGGGETTALGWRLGFFSLAFLVCLGPIATYFSHRRV